MDIRYCKMCGKMYNYDPEKGSTAICPECQKKVEDKFETVRDYIRDHPENTIKKISTELDVPVQIIKKWIREERLVLVSPDSGINLRCEKCGKPILTGRFCENCKKKMASNFENVLGRSKPECPALKSPSDARDRMHYNK
ncbi:MAG: flagellar protein [Lachnospiraceae bacterium]|jgi:predicted amidophosphoribosyltransferase|nr:flagellar protein [Lachnospiraceae bacterium]MEE3460978.1 flagellar protein [Lachnospiraceae bacterium]